MAAVYAGIAIEAVPVKTDDKPAVLIEANPLGKIPVLVLDDGRSIHDSRAITQHLNRLSKNALFPRNPDKRLEAEVLEALADGICDCALSMVYERRTRPEEMVYQPWLDRQWAKITSGTRPAQRQTRRSCRRRSPSARWRCAPALAISHCASPEMGKGRARLTRWAARFDEKFPELKPCIPGDRSPA